MQWKDAQKEYELVELTHFEQQFCALRLASG
jgi:hypothetical protein